MNKVGKATVSFSLASLLTLSIVAVTIFSTVNSVSTEEIGTPVSGIISTYTTWTETNSPYTLTGNLLVSNNVTLTIQPGVTVNIGNYYIMVNGTLNSIGDSSNPISFHGGQILFTEFGDDWNEATKTGSIIEKSNLTSSIAISNSICINDNTVYGGITISKTSSENITTANPVVSNNTFLGQGISANLFNVNPTISNNTFSGCSTAINVLLDHNSSAIIEGNLIVNNIDGIGLYAWFPWNSPLIQHNTITNNTNGISVGALGDTFYPRIVSNNIYDNTDYNLKTELSYGINATNNWWGTVNAQTIDQKIFDNNDDFNLGTVAYSPFLNTPNTQAPTYANASAGIGGSIVPSGLIKVNNGDSQTFNIKPDGGYVIADVFINGTSIGALFSYTAQNVQGATDISVTFAPAPMGPTQVGGILSKNTIWSASGSPYNFPGNVLVDVGQTLTIEPGVAIQFNGYFMNVGGTLSAKGSETEKITMIGSDISYAGEWKGRIVFLSTSIDSILEYAEITSTPDTIIGIYSSTTVDNCVINGTSGTALAIMAGPNAVPNITKNTISNNNVGVSLDSTDTNVTPQISKNVIINNSGSGITINHGQPLISENRIENNSNGIYYYGGINGNDSCTLLENIISNNTYGINVNPSGFGRVFNITKNLIINNFDAILMQHLMGWSGGLGNIIGNTIARNGNGIVSTVSVSLAINQNNIYENSNYCINLASSSDTNATNNWWGTTNASLIDQAIYDFYDDFNLGKVLINPYLTNPSLVAPVVPTFTISSSAGTGGSISPSGVVDVNYGGNQIFIVTPDAGYYIVNVLMD